MVVGSLCLDYYYLEEDCSPLPFPGGKGGNQAVAAKRLGADVSLAAKVGEDRQGKFLLKQLQKEGLATELIEKKKGLATGWCRIQVKDGEHTICGFPGANLSWQQKDLDLLLPRLSEADCLLLQFEIPPAFVWQLLEFAQALGILVILNPAPPRETAFPTLGKNTYLVVNQKEAHFYSQIPCRNLAAAKKAASSLSKLGGQVVITLGKEGALAATEKSMVHVPAPEVEATDTVGAGDTFCAAMAVSLLEGKPLLSAVRFATEAAARATTALGAQSASP